MINEETLVETVLSFKGFSPSGRSCKFIKLNDELGIKCYQYRGTRNRCVDRQKKAEAISLAPKTGISFDVGDVFCYVTEIAKPYVAWVENETEEQFWKRHDELWDSSSCDHLKIEIGRVTAEIKAKTGFDMYDTHLGNFGELNGKMVCIDFD